jgi:hypothetical protein
LSRSRSGQNVYFTINLFDPAWPADERKDDHPGECLELTVGVEFRTAGPANLSEFYVQADPTDGGGGAIVRLPDRKLRVIPSSPSTPTMRQPKT